MRVAALAVGIARIVVAVAVVLGHQRLDHRLDVLDEGALELVDEQRARGVQRIDEQDAFLHVRAQHDVPDLLGDVEDLGVVLTQHRESLPHDLEGLHCLASLVAGASCHQRPCTCSPRCWCRGRESNPHGPAGPADFKSAASPSSATPAPAAPAGSTWRRRADSNR